MIDPRPYQASAIDAVVDAWAAGQHAPVVALPTGSGKTMAAALLLAKVRSEGGPRAAWLTDRQGLLDQTRVELEACGLSVAVVQAPQWHKPPASVRAADVVLVMSQTAQSRAWLPEDLGVGVAVIDEAHYERSVTRRWLATGVPTVGLTATPFAQWMGRAILGEPLDDVWTGPLVAPLTTRQLIAQAVLLAPVMSSEQEDPTELDDPATGKRFERGGGDWSDQECERIMDPYTTMIAKRWRELCDAPVAEGGFAGDQPPTLVLASTIDHAGVLADAFRRAAGYGRIWSVLSARQTTDQSDKILKAYRLGRVDGIVSVHKVSVGIDLPTATIGVSARPTRSLTAWVQFLGRFMRVPPAGGFLRPTIQDWGGTALRLALDVHEVWSRGPTWPPTPKVERASSGSRTSNEPGLPEPCPHHPRIVHPPGDTHCTVCGRPLAQAEPKGEKVRKRYRVDAITARDIGRSVLRMAQDRACRPPLDKGVTARRWARAMVWQTTGRPPRRDWPAGPWRDATLPMPHPLVALSVRRAARQYAAWMDEPEEDRSKRPPTVTPLQWEE